jgi:Rieske 2Fe-2S family protein
MAEDRRTGPQRHHQFHLVVHVAAERGVGKAPTDRSRALAPERTRLIAEWHFSPQTLAQPGFDAGTVAAFAKIVMEQDGEASEMNQRGMRSPAFRAARLMPEEYEIHRFQEWVLNEMETHA